MDQSHLDDLRAVLDYAQPDEEHDWNLNPEDEHIVYPMRRLRAALDSTLRQDIAELDRAADRGEPPYTGSEES